MRDSQCATQGVEDQRTCLLAGRCAIRRRSFRFTSVATQAVRRGDPPTPTTYTANDLNQYTATATPSESFTYDFDGNLTADATFTYTWDAENRLIEVAPVSPDDGDIKLVFDYDYMSRRVRKREVEWDETLNGGNGGWKDKDTSAKTDLKLVYDGWNVVLVLNADNETQRKYTWGLDLSGLSGGASRPVPGVAGRVKVGH